MNEERLQTDILIIGGGAAGLNAAITARRAGLHVIVMDKAVIERSGHFAGGIDHFAAYLETGPDWDTSDAYLDFTARSSRGATDISVVERVYCNELKTAIQRFDDVGCTLRRKDGTFFRTQSYGHPGPWWINFNGKRLKPLLAGAAREAGCKLLDRVVTADLLVNDGQVCGAAGFHIRSGIFYVVQAKAVLMTTGGTNRLFQNPTGLSFNIWMCPANTGDGEAMRHLVTTLGYDKDTLPDFFVQKGIDLSRDLLEIATSEGMQGGPNEVCGSGIKIDGDCATNIPGLFAAGNSADQCRSLHMAFTSGIHAGRTMSVFAGQKMKRAMPVPENQVKDIRKRLFEPMKAERAVSWHEFEDVLQRILSEGMGPVRSGWGMKIAWQKLDELEKWQNQVRADSYHDLCRTQEVYNMLTVARCMIRAALHRKESRFGQCHYRMDFPETDDNSWLGQIAVNKAANGRIQTQLVPLSYE